MKSIENKVICFAVMGMLFVEFTVAQEVNQPTHLPNEAANKVTHYRLQALTSEEAAKQQQEGSAGDSFNSGDKVGCNIDIGNTTESSGFGNRTNRNEEKDIIIVGDVINACP